MNKPKITSIGDLRSEIVRLRAEVEERELSIQRDVNHLVEQVRMPLDMLKKISSWFTGEKGSKEAISSDWVTTLAQLGFPYLLNSIFFKKSGIVMKALIAFVSQQAVKSINLDTITSWIEKISHWMKKEGKKKKQETEPKTDGQDLT
jgi:hypothetical protein